jgi:hypothetical protein
LLRNRMTDVSVNHLLLQMLSKSFSDSCMRFYNRTERRVRAGTLRALTHHGHDIAGQAEGRSTNVLNAPPGWRWEGPQGQTGRVPASFVHRQGGAEQGWVGGDAAPFQRVLAQVGSEVTGKAPAPGEDMHHACRAGPQPPSNTTTWNRRSCRLLYQDLIRFCQQGWEGAHIQLGHINRGLRDPRINPELEADTRGDSILGVMLLWPCWLGDLGDWLSHI